MTNIIISGTRNFNDYDALLRCISSIYNKLPIDDICIISGCANGVDTLAIRFALRNNLILKKFPADWNTFGKSAGFRRNIEMADYALTGDRAILLAIWDCKSHGTKNMIAIAKARNIESYVFTY